MATEMERLEWRCDGFASVFHAADGETTVYGVDERSGEVVSTHSVPLALNAMGHNLLDGMAYGWSATDNQVVRLHPDLGVDLLGQPGGTAGESLFGGDVDEQGRLWLSSSSVRQDDTRAWFRVDVAAGDVTSDVVSGTWPVVPSYGAPSDFAVLGDHGYTVLTHVSDALAPPVLVRFDLTSGTTEVLRIWRR